MDYTLYLTIQEKNSALVLKRYLIMYLYQKFI